MQVYAAKYAGACFGVSRALELAYKAASEADGRVFTLGPLIHNPLVIKDLTERGVHTLSENDISRISSDDCVIVRTHGVSKTLMKSLCERTSHVIDATCPFVAKAQKAAEAFAQDNKLVVIVGEAKHPETLGIAGQVDKAFIIEKGQVIPNVLSGKEVGVVAQTTQSFRDVSNVVEKVSLQAGDVIFENTICSATRQRQEAAEQLAQHVDAMVVIGGKNSANTRRLVEISTQYCKTYHIEGPTEVEKLPLRGSNAIGITAGASTPFSHVEEARAKIEKM